MKKAMRMALLVGSCVLLMGAPVWADQHEGHSNAAGAEHEPAEGEAGEHGHGDHVPHFSDINWMHGLLGEKEGAEPSLLWRPPGMPVPFGAVLINFGILVYLIVRFGGPGIRQGLVNRKKRIAGDIDRAAEMRKEAEQQLASYEDKLEQMEAEMARIRKEMEQQADADRQRIIAEAKERQQAIEADARELIERELAHAKQDACMRAVSGAVEAAREQVKQTLSAQDHERLSQEFLGSLQTHMKKSQEADS